MKRWVLVIVVVLFFSIKLAESQNSTNGTNSSANQTTTVQMPQEKTVSSAKSKTPAKTELKLTLIEGYVGSMIDLAQKTIEIVNQQVVIPNHTIVIAKNIWTVSTKEANSFALSAVKEGSIGILGPVLSNQAIVAGVTAGNIQTPMITFLATTLLLSDRLTFPYLLRTIPSSLDQGIAIVALLKYYGWNKVGLLSSTNEYGLGTTASILNESAKQKIQTHFYFFNQKDKNSRLQLLAIRNLGLRVILLIGLPTEVIAALDYASELDMIGKPYVYVTPLVTNAEVTNQTTGITNQTLAKYLTGTLVVGAVNVDLKAKINQELFPTGYVNEAVLQMPYLTEAIYAFAYAFKKLIVEEKLTIEEFKGKKLLDTLYDIQFKDPTLSTPTTFRFSATTGTSEDVRFTVYNFNESGIRSPVGQYVNGKLTITEDIVWPEGFGTEVPDSTPVTNITYFSCPLKNEYTDTRGIVKVDSPTDKDPTNLPPGVYCNEIIDCQNWEDEPFSCSPSLRTGYIVIGILVGIGFLYLLFSLIMIIFWRLKPRLRAAGVVFLLLSCISSITGIVSIFFTFGKADPYTCMCFYWFLVLSASVLMGSLMAKQYRVWKVFSNKSVNPVAFTETRLFVFSILISVPDFLVLLFWTVLDFPVLEIYEDDNARCRSSLQILYYVLILVMKAILALGSLTLAILCRKFPSAFSDSRIVGFSIYNECLIGVVAIPVVLSLDSSAFIQWLLMSLSILFFFLSTFGILMTPKLYGLMFVDKKSSSTGSSPVKFLKHPKTSSNTS